MNEQTATLLREIEKITGATPVPAKAVGYDPAFAVMAHCAEKPNRYYLNEKEELIGLNLGGLGITDSHWQTIVKHPGFYPEKLEALNLSRNLLSVSPVSPEMRKLKHLDLRDNKITEFEPPQPLALEHVLLYGNEMTSPPLEVLSRGKDAILNYFKERAKQPTRKLREAKLLLLGEPGAGKTTLARKLLDIYAPLPGKGESTRGIVIETLLIGSEADPFTARIWDFGGQQIYHGTHRFFLTKRSLWVIVADNRKQNTDFNYWLQMAELYGDNSPLYIVVNQSDDRPAYLNTEGMKDRFDFLKEMLAANLDTLGEALGENNIEGRKRNTEDTLRMSDILKNRILNLPHIGIEWPKSWTDVRQDLELIVEQEKLDYITLDRYYDVCKKHGLTEREGQLHLSAFLHDLGVMLHFQADPVLRETVILSMEWATQAVFAAYDSFLVNSGDRPGFFRKSDIAQIWGGSRFRDKQDQLLALMVLFKLCYRVKDSEIFIMPELLPATQPDYAALIPELNKEQLEGAHAVRYSYDFMPKGIFTRFAVEVHRLIAFSQQLIWREGAVLQAGDSYALITETYGNREIVVRCTGLNRKELMTIATHHLDEIHAGFSKLQVKKLVPCNCDTCKKLPVPHYYDHKNLLDRLQRKKGTVECANSFLDVPVQVLLDTLFTTADERKESFEKVALEAPATKKDTGIKIFISYSKSDKASLEVFKKHLSPLLRSKKATVWYDEMLEPGGFWDSEIKKNLKDADIVLFLVSSDFLATDYIWEEELLTTIKRSREGLTTAMPVILRTCDWLSTPLKDLSALPAKGKPISSFTDVDSAYLEVVKGVLRVIEAKNKPQ